MPLPFMPEVVQRVLKVLPFAAMQNVPFRIYSGDLSGHARAEAIFFKYFGSLCLLELDGDLLNLLKKS